MAPVLAIAGMVARAVLANALFDPVGEIPQPIGVKVIRANPYLPPRQTAFPQRIRLFPSTIPSNYALNGLCPCSGLLLSGALFHNALTRFRPATTKPHPNWGCTSEYCGRALFLTNRG